MRPIHTRGENIREVDDGNGIGLAVNTTETLCGGLVYRIFTWPKEVTEATWLSKYYDSDVIKDMKAFLRGE